MSIALWPQSFDSKSQGIPQSEKTYFPVKPERISITHISNAVVKTVVMVAAAAASAMNP